MVRDKIVIAAGAKKSRRYLLRDEDGNYVDLSSATLALTCKDEAGNTETLGTVTGNTDGFTIEIDATSATAKTVHFCQVVNQDTDEIIKEFLVYIKEETT